MGNGRKFGPEGPPGRAPEDARRTVASDAAEASEKAARSADLQRSRPCPARPLGAGLRSAVPEAPGPSDPKRRSSPDPGNRAEASTGDASGSAAAGAPSPALPDSPARGPRRADARRSWAAIASASPDEAQGLGGRAKRRRPRKPGPPAAKPPRQAPPPGPRRSAPTAAPPRTTPARHPTRSAVVTEASGTARRAESRKARRLRPRLPARTPLPCSRPPGASAAASPRSPRPPRPTPARRRPTTPSAPTPATGGNSRRGFAARGLRRRRPTRKRSASTSLRKSNAAGGAFGRDPRAAALRHRLALPSTRRATRDPRPPYRHGARRYPPPPRPPSPAKGRDFRR